MTSKKYSSAVLQANGGLHSERALYTAHDILKNHDLRQPVLFHMVFTGSQVKADYKAAIKALVKRLRTKCRVEYFGAFEVAEDRGGLHAHCFFVIETSKHFPTKILNVNDGEFLHRLTKKHNLAKRIHIAHPENPMHGGEFFARPVKEGGKLTDCLAWVSYEFKQRSKESVPGRETYFNSEFRANVAQRAAVKVAKGYVAA